MEAVSETQTSTQDVEMPSTYLRVIPRVLRPDHSMLLPRMMAAPRSEKCPLRPRCPCPPYGVRAITGRYPTMEDALAIVENLIEIPLSRFSSPLQSPKHIDQMKGSQNGDSSSEESGLTIDGVCENEVLHFFGVYDGHNGPYAASHCQEHLHENLRATYYDSLTQVTSDGTLWTDNLHNFQMDGTDLEKDMEELFFEAFRQTDRQFAKYKCSARVGTTALTALVGSRSITVGNCGDSRAVLYRSGHAIPMSVDHSLDRLQEKDRIERCGGRVVHWNGTRVMGVLAMSRAIGDLSFRRYGVICDPEVMTKPRSIDDEYLLLATDGLWDVLTNEEAYHILNHSVEADQSEVKSVQNCVQNAVNKLTKIAIDRGSRGNITVVLVDLHSNTQLSPDGEELALNVDFC